MGLRPRLFLIEGFKSAKIKALKLRSWNRIPNQRVRTVFHFNQAGEGRRGLVVKEHSYLVFLDFID